MKKLYSAQVARPLAATNTRPTRLGFATTAWCRCEDLIAAISGCGAVAVFHADAPGEATLLVGLKRAPARHVIWRNAPDKPAMLVVADAAGRITFWLARDRRVNVWSAVSTVDLSAVAVAVGWNRSCTALAAVLANGGLSVYAVRDEPFDNTRRRPYQKSRDPSRRYLADPKWSQAAVKSIPCNQKVADLFGGQLRCATVAPSHLDPTTVAVVTVSAEEPHKLKVWQVNIGKTGTATFDIKPKSLGVMDKAEDGQCVACSVVPKSGILLGVGDRGVIARWLLKNQRGTTGDSGWKLQQKTRIDRATEDAVARGIIPRIHDNENAMVNAITRGLQVSRKRKVYALEVPLDPKTIVTSTSAGLLVWDMEKLNVIGGHSLKAVDGIEGSPYWGLCISPGGAAVMALNGQGRVDTFSLISPLTRGSPEAVSAVAMSIAKRLVATTYTDGLRGGWDLIAAVASEGPAAASLVAKTLTLNNTRNPQNAPASSETLANLKSLLMRIVNVQDSTAHAAKRLLDVAIDAIRQSAPDYVKLKLMVGAKEAEQLTSVENIRKLIEEGLSTTRVHRHQLAAAPLADWIMVLCAVWLQRCAAVVARHDSAKSQLGTAWASLASLASPGSATGQGNGMVGDPMLIHLLRSAALAAVVLVALEDEHGEPDADPRYYRFPREQSAQVIAALWEVSVAWNSGEAGSRPMVNGTPPSGTASGQTAEHIQNAALVFRKHEAAAHAIASVDKLRVIAAEKALGLHGSAIGAGFIMSCTRKPLSSSADHKATDGKTGEKAPKTEWCPYDLVTGRPLPPWAPLRRCIASGLLAAEITQQKSDSTASVNGASPWISKWANVSPFGGRWARVPSLDLDRYELLPSVVHAASRTDNVASRQPKPEVALSQQSALSGGVAHARAQLQGAGAMANQPFSINTVPNAEAAALAAVAVGNPMAQMLGNANPQLQQGMPGMPTNAILQGALAGRMPTGAARAHASPRMSTASSTTDAGSSISKGARKRMSSKPTGRVRKRVAREPRTPTASQLSDLTRTMGMNGMQSGASPAAYGRTPSAPDAMSTDTRSTMTTATNATGGVDQDMSKTGRKSRKRSSKKQQQADAAAQTKQAMQAAAAASAAAAAAAASAAGGIPPTGGTLPPGVAPALSQSSPASHAPQTPRSASQSKKQQARGSQRNQVTAAAHAAAAAAAAAAAGVNKQSPMARNSAMLQGGLTPEALAAAAAAGMNKAVDPMSPLGFVSGNPAVNAAGNPMAANARRANMPPGANAAMMANGNAANLGLNGLLQQGNFGMQGVGDSSMAGINGQTPADMAGMQQMPGANAPVGTVGASLATLALQLGVSPNQFTGFTPEEAQQTYQALSRRVAYQNAAALGPGNVQGTPPTAATNPNPLANMSAALTATDMNSNAAAAGIGRMASGSTGLPLGTTVPQGGRGMSGPAAIGSMGLPMTTPRSSGAESQTSARVAGGSIGGAGIPNTPTQTPADRDSTAAGGVIGGVPTPGAPGVQATAGATASGDRSRRVWRGALHVEGQSLDMTRSIVGIQHDLPTKAPIGDTSGWPRRLDLNSTKLKSSTQVLDWMNAPESQWYVRFAPVDKNGQEREDLKVRQLVTVMVDQKLVFEIKCNEEVGTPGTLYVWGMPLQPHGPSLLGVFKPDEPRAVDQELQLMLS